MLFPQEDPQQGDTTIAAQPIEKDAYLQKALIQEKNKNKELQQAIVKLS